MEKPKYVRIQSYGSMSSARSEDDMTVRSQLFPYSKKMVVEREMQYEEDHPPFQPLSVTTKLFGDFRCNCLLGIYILFYVVFLIAGAIVFSALESPQDELARQNVISAKEDFMIRYPNILGR
ncbi:unnamed protein product [Parnassius mnemosyne]|uniref:Uncharacterized protein n=1 Tax=Parnassius mnemosyne TaxID=213953 RepID=A0AAV1KV93_9NEOP